jgi:hypothetical protein
MIRKSFMVIVLACTFADAFVGNLVADKADSVRAVGQTPGQPGSHPPPGETTRLLDALGQAASQLPSETDRIAIPQIRTQLQKMDYYTLLQLKLLPPTDVCQQIACLEASPDTVHRYVESYLSVRIADDNHRIAEANSATAVNSEWISIGSLFVAFFALLVSFFKPAAPPAPATGVPTLVTK